MGKRARRAAEAAAGWAADHGGSSVDQITGQVWPTVRQATGQAAAIIGPAVDDARRRIEPIAADWADRLTPLLVSASQRLGHTWTHDVSPWIDQRLTQASQDPRLADATRRARSALAALNGDLLLPEPPVPAPVTSRRHRLLRTIGIGLGVAGLTAGLIAALRSFLGTTDDGWSPQHPLQPDTDDDWGPTPFTSPDTDTSPDADTGTTSPSTDTDPNIPAEPDVDTTTPTTTQQATATMDAEGAAQTPATNPYGDGAYVGTEPPAGYIIKGNQRSMKYHVPTASGYHRTNADVWFNSEQAAEAAGFTRAQR